MSTTKLREDTLSHITGGKKGNSLQALWTHHPAQMDALKDMCSEYANCVRNWKKQRPFQALPLGNKGLLNVEVSFSCYFAPAKIHIVTRNT